MVRSSRNVALAAALIALLGGAGPLAAASRPPAHAAFAVTRHGASFVGGRGRGIAARGARRDRGGFGFGGAALYAPPPDDPGPDVSGPLLAPGLAPPAPARPCVGPMIITLAPPVRRDVRAPSVVYGAPPCVTPTYRPMPSNWPKF
jgi:hypothetical protein